MLIVSYPLDEPRSILEQRCFEAAKAVRSARFRDGDAGYQRHFASGGVEGLLPVSWMSAMGARKMPAACAARRPGLSCVDKDSDIRIQPSLGSIDSSLYLHLDRLTRLPAGSKEHAA